MGLINTFYTEAGVLRLKNTCWLLFRAIDFNIIKEYLDNLNLSQVSFQICIVEKGKVISKMKSLDEKFNT